MVILSGRTAGVAQKNLGGRRTSVFFPGGPARGSAAVTAAEASAAAVADSLLPAAASALADAAAAVEGIADAADGAPAAA